MGLFNFGRKSKEEEKQTLDEGLAKTKTSFFQKLTKSILGKSTVDDDVLDNLEETLVTSDVGVDTTLKIIDHLQERIKRDRYISTSDKQLELSYEQNSIELAFSNLDFAGINSTQYRYYLEGAEQDWRQLTSDNSARYNGLPPGTYQFHLSSLNKNNQWSEEYVFTVIIRQPWYNTWWAWLIYLFIIGILCWYFYRSWRRNFELDQQIRVEKELTTFRLNFFTHIAHEFRTPLAIISGAADKLTQKGNDTQVSRSAVQTVRRGTLRLTKLVNQLMEFRRINTGNQRLAVVEDDIIKLALHPTGWQHQSEGQAFRRSAATATDSRG